MLRFIMEINQTRKKDMIRFSGLGNIMKTKIKNWAVESWDG